MRLAAALGTALKRGARVVAEPRVAARVPDDQAGDDLRPDLDRRGRRRPARDPGGGRRATSLKTEGYDAGVHVGVSPSDPELVRIQFFEPPGIADDAAHAEGDREALHARRAAARRLRGVGAISYPSAYARATRTTCSTRSTWRRSASAASGIVIDYGYSAASFVLPLVLAPLGVEVVSAHEFATDRGTGGAAARGDRAGEATRRGRRRRPRRRLRPLGGAPAPDRRAGAEMPRRPGAAAVPPADRLERPPGKLAFPVTVTSHVERARKGASSRSCGRRRRWPTLTRSPRRTASSSAARSRRLRLPEFLPAYDAVASLCKLLELLAPVERPLSALVAALPRPRSSTARSRARGG